MMQRKLQLKDEDVGVKNAALRESEAQRKVLEDKTAEVMSELNTLRGKNEEGDARILDLTTEYSNSRAKLKEATSANADLEDLLRKERACTRALEEDMRVHLKRHEQKQRDATEKFKSMEEEKVHLRTVHDALAKECESLRTMEGRVRISSVGENRLPRPTTTI